MEYDDEIRQNRNRIDDAIYVSLAGPYAQRRHDPSSKWRRGKDLKEASDLIYCLHRHCRSARDRAISSFWRHTNIIIGDFLETNWNAIETLAHRLIRDRTVSKEEAVNAGLEMAMVDLSDLAATSSFLRDIMGLNQDDRRS